MCKYENERVQVTATSGTAAVLVNGITIHSALGLGRANLPAADLYRDMAQSAKDWWRQLRALVVEEYSLMSAKTLTLVDTLGKLFKGNNLPFGGVRVILLGDGAQLAPIPPYEPDANSKGYRKQHVECYAARRGLHAVLMSKSCKGC